MVWAIDAYALFCGLSAVVADETAAACAGALVYVCSDVPAVSADAAAQLEAATPPRLRRFRGARPPEDVLPSSQTTGAEPKDPPLMQTDAEGWLSGSPFGAGVVFTERDKVCELLWRKVFRALFIVEQGS